MNKINNPTKDEFSDIDHESFLENKEANETSKQASIKAFLKIGYTLEEIEKLMRIELKDEE